MPLGKSEISKLVTLFSALNMAIVCPLLFIICILGKGLEEDILMIDVAGLG
jgi:hypothetical protein